MYLVYVVQISLIGLESLNLNKPMTFNINTQIKLLKQL